MKAKSKKLYSYLKSNGMLATLPTDETMWPILNLRPTRDSKDNLISITHL